MQPPSASKEQVGGCRSGTAAHDAPSKKASLPPPQATTTSKSSHNTTASRLTSSEMVQELQQVRKGLGVLFGQSAFSRSAASSGEKHHSTTPAICGQPSPHTQPADIACTRITATARPFELEPVMMEWLDDLGMRESVKQRFIHERIDCEHLASMSHDQLEQLGVNKVFYRPPFYRGIMIVHDIPCYNKCIHRLETDSSS